LGTSPSRPLHTCAAGLRTRCAKPKNVDENRLGYVAHPPSGVLAQPGAAVPQWSYPGRTTPLALSSLKNSRSRSSASASG
jgi:hypothetical protein